MWVEASDRKMGGWQSCWWVVLRIGTESQDCIELCLLHRACISAWYAYWVFSLCRINGAFAVPNMQDI